MQVCARCKCKRDLAAFGDDSICSPCKLREAFDVCLCGMCGKINSTKDMQETVPGSGDFLCSACAPKLRLLKCTVCDKMNRAISFRGFRWGLGRLERQTIRRCKTCEACIGCKRHFDDFNNFQTNARFCRSCYRKLVASKECRVCKLAKTAKEFPYNRINDESRPTRNFFLRCTSCHTFKTCNQLKEIQAFDSDSPNCVKCAPLQ